MKSMRIWLYRECLKPRNTWLVWALCKLQKVIGLPSMGDLLGSDYKENLL